MALFLVVSQQAQNANDFLTLTDGTLSASWKYYPSGHATPAQIFAAIAGTSGATAGITSGKKLTITKGGNTLRIDLSSAALATYLGFNSAAANIGTTITADNAITAVECVSIDPGLSYAISGAEGHGIASQGAQKVSATIKAVMSPSELSTLITATEKGCYVTPCDTDRGLYPWTLSATSIRTQILSSGSSFSSTGRYQVDLAGLVHP
jgi:hypothetical protein